MFTPLHNMGLSTTVLAENNRITLSKESVMKTLSKLQDAYLFYLMSKRNLINYRCLKRALPPLAIDMPTDLCKVLYGR